MEKELHEIIKKQFGHELREYRVIGQNFTQERLAQETGLGPDHIGKMESGYKLPRIETLLRLRNAGVDINGILDRVIAELYKQGIDIRKD